MTVDELIEKLVDASCNGYGERDVVIPCGTGGSYTCDDVEAEEDDFLVRLS